MASAAVRANNAAPISTTVRCEASHGAIHVSLASARDNE